MAWPGREQIDIEECTFEQLRTIVRLLLDRENLKVVIESTPDYDSIELAENGDG